MSRTTLLRLFMEHIMTLKGTQTKKTPPHHREFNNTVISSHSYFVQYFFLPLTGQIPPLLFPALGSTLSLSCPPVFCV